jgi:hypothetical protein
VWFKLKGFESRANDTVYWADQQIFDWNSIKGVERFIAMTPGNRECNIN